MCDLCFLGVNHKAVHWGFGWATQDASCHAEIDISQNDAGTNETDEWHALKNDNVSHHWYILTIHRLTNHNWKLSLYQK